MLVQQDVDSDSPPSSIENVRKYVNIGEHVHHYGNDLSRGEAKSEIALKTKTRRDARTEKCERFYARE